MIYAERVTFVQKVRVPFQLPMLQTRYDLIERTIVRQIDPDGRVVSEEIVDEALIRCHCDLDEEIIGLEMMCEEKEEIISETVKHEE